MKTNRPGKQPQQGAAPGEVPTPHVARAAARKKDVPILDPSEYDRLAAFRYALRSFLRFSEDAAAQVGLTPQHYQALLVLRNGGSITINALAEQLLIKHNSSVGLVDRLVERRLVRRERSAADRREVMVRMTSKGLLVLDGLASVHRHELQHVAPELSRVLAGFARAPLNRPPVRRAAARSSRDAHP